jgi:glutathione synthase/RimK-type ligase-like ATP-grasp enzyme
LICDDKAAQYEILSKLKIDSFIHKYFFSLPIDYNVALGMLSKYKALVVKLNNGTGGRNIYKASNKKELIKYINTIAGNSGRFTLSPYYKYDKEYRIVMLYGIPQLIYLKERQHVVGDGKHSLRRLLKLNKTTPTNLFTFSELNYVPKINEKINVN